MLHNFVLTQVGAGNEVGELALKLGVQGEKMNFVPTTPKVLAYTTILQPGKTETIYFRAPAEPGSYPFICSYPGHYFIMKGILKVIK
jgi:azurin